MKKHKAKTSSQRVTSKKVATIAAKELGDSQTPKKYRPPIASALAQAAKHHKSPVRKKR